MNSEYENLRIKFPSRIPVILHKMRGRCVRTEFKDDKYLVPKDLAIAHFMFILRNRLKSKLKDTEAIFLFVKEESTENYSIPLSSDSFETLFEKFGFKDGHLPIYFASENTFG